MTAVIDIIQKITSIIASILVILTATVNAPFNGNVEKWKCSSTVVGLETLTRSQDVTTDGEFFYFSGKNSLEKTDLSCEKIVALNTSAIPNELQEKYGSAHIGGISYYNGKLYAAVEDSDVWNYPLIVLYDCQTLEYTGEYYILPTTFQKRGVPWIAIDGNNRIAYTGDSRNYNEIFKFSLDDFSYLETISLSSEVKKIQGAEISDGFLYAGTNDIKRAVYKINLSNGNVEKLFERISYEYKLIDNFGGEGEGLTVLKMPDGTFIHTLQLGALFIDSSLRHYEAA